MGDSYLFKQRYFDGDEVYLFPKDCAEALGYESVDSFIEDYQSNLQQIDGIGYMMKEGTFNHILLTEKSKESLPSLGYIEVTKIQTLRSQIESIKNRYGLSFSSGLSNMVFGSEAKAAGFKSIEEYLAKCDMPQKIRKALDGIKNSSSELDTYKKKISQLKDKNFIDPEILKENGLELQIATAFSPEGYYIAMAFITGCGIFYQVHIPDEYLDEWKEDYTGIFISNDGSLCIFNPTEEEDVCRTYKVIGKTHQDRDFREFSVLENIAWVAQNANYDDEMYKLPGVKMCIENQLVLQLLTQNPTIPGMLIEGELNMDETTYITDTRMKPKG